MRIMISSCLCGVKCKYNGDSNLNPYFVKMQYNHQITLVCPEILGGLSIPRSPGEIQNGTGLEVLAGARQVLTKAGSDVTSAFIIGAERTLELAQAQAVDLVILKSRSPSCGVGTIYNGAFNSTLINGDGVTAAFLKQHGFRVISDETYLYYFPFKL